MSSEIGLSESEASACSSSCLPEETKTPQHFNRRFYGRHQELERLRSIYEGRLFPAVLVSGLSGTGKSALAQQFAFSVVGNSSQILEGKYEELHDPFSAISQAFGAYFSKHKNSRKIKESLTKTIGDEGSIICDMIPSLRPLVFKDTDLTNQVSTTTKKEHQMNQLCFMFLKLVKALTELDTIILVLHDLQCADVASLELLAFVLKSSLSNFFLLGTLRSNQLDETHPLISWREQIRTKFQVIHLGNHSQEDIGLYLAQELNCAPEECEVLTETIYQHTEGNFFFTMQALSELLRTGLICQEQEGKFSWDDEEIRQSVTLSSNMLDAISSKISHLPQLLQTALQLAAYLRSSFDLETLRLLLRKRGHSVTHSELTKLLDVAVMEGLLYNVVGSKNYQFAHDGIQETAFSMVAQGKDRDELRFRIGQFLYALHTDDWMMFVAAHHWMAASHLVPPLELARLLEKVGTKAISLAAFEQAAHYYARAIAALEQVEYPWSLHYNLALTVYSSAAEMELCLGRYERGYELSGIVLEQAHSLLDKMPTYFAMEAALAISDRNAEALMMNLKVLEELGEMPRTLTAIRDVIQVKRLVQNQSDVEALLRLPQMTDPYKLAAMKCLANVAIRAYSCGKASLVARSVIKQVRLVVRYGHCSQAALAFAQYGGILLIFLNEQTSGRRMGLFAREILGRRGGEPIYSKDVACRTLYILAGFIDAWSIPLPEVMKTYERAHQLGMESGDLGFAHLAALQANAIAYVSGHPLPSIAATVEKLTEQLKHYNQHFICKMLENLSLLVHHLRGRQDNDQIDWTAMEKFDETDTNIKTQLVLSWGYFVRMQLAYYMNELEIADRMSQKFKAITKAGACIFISLGLYFHGLIASGLARKTGHRKYRIMANKAMKRMKKLVNIGGLNNLHKCYLMEAECLRTQKQSAVKQKYDKAIAVAAEARCLQDEALANELAGEYFLGKQERFWTRHYFTQACGLYEEWGCQVKVDQLMQKRSEYVCKTEYSGSMASFTAPMNSKESMAITKESNMTIEFGHDDSAADDDCSVLTDIREIRESQQGIATVSSGDQRTSN